MVDDHYNREMIILPVPSEARWRVKFVPYFKSTGTSNRTNFEGTYFPFVQISPHRDWIQKFGGDQLIKSYKLKEPAWYSFISKSQLCTFEHPKQLLLYRFTEWWQIRLSAKMGDGIWQTAELAELKKFAIQFAWIDGKFIEDPLPEWSLEKCIKNSETSQKRIAETINQWIADHNALLSPSYVEATDYMVKKMIEDFNAS